MPTSGLNLRAFRRLRSVDAESDDLRIQQTDLSVGGRLYDFGVEVSGGLRAGLVLAEVCLAGLGEVSLLPGSIDGIDWPQVFVSTDHPVSACLLSQYAGWQINVGQFFAMGSGPMRAAAAREEVFGRLNYREPQPAHVVGVLEAAKLPDDDVFALIAEKTGVPVENVALLVAPTSSPAGNLQVAARSVETVLHKLFELQFDVTRIVSACGTVPLSPVAADDLTGIGRTNDAILYGGCVTLWVRGDDQSLAEIGPRVPAAASECYGKPFLEIFEEAGRDFYAIDPLLFSPGQVVFQNLETGRVHQFGTTAPDVLKSSFGLSG